MNTKTDNINYQFKLLYAIGMLFVVMSHSSYAGFSFATNWFPFGGFHVGLFVFCSGYLYKSSSQENVPNYLLKKVKRLIIPLYLWNVFYAILVIVLARFGFSIGGAVTWDKLVLMPLWNGHQFMYNMGSWFVFPFFLIEVINVLLRKLLRVESVKKEITLFVIYLALGIVGNYMTIRGMNAGYGIIVSRTLYLIPFWGLGMLYKNVLEKHDKLNNVLYFGIIFLIQLGIMAVFRRVPAYSASWCDNFTEGPVMPIIAGYLGVLFWLRVSRLLTPALGKSRAVLAVANNSYSIMLNQFLGFMLVKGFFGVCNSVISMGFDWDLFRSDIWYYFYPEGAQQIGILYVVAGIVVPVLMQKVVDLIWRRIRGSRDRKEVVG